LVCAAFRDRLVLFLGELEGEAHLLADWETAAGKDVVLTKPYGKSPVRLELSFPTVAIDVGIDGILRQAALVSLDMFLWGLKLRIASQGLDSNHDQSFFRVSAHNRLLFAFRSYPSSSTL
jgi:hypothetical protein